MLLMRMVLYKYFSLEKEEHFKFLESYFKQQIWLSSLSSFNDPFEGNFLLKSFRPDTILARPKLLEQLLELNRQNGKPDLNRETFISQLRSEEFQETLLAQSSEVRNLFQSHGAICLTPDPTNIPMWAYYGNNHKGCCLRFELDFQLIQDEIGISDLKLFKQDIHNGKTLISFHLPQTDYEFVLSKVQYEEEMPAIDLNEVIEFKTIIEQIKYLVSRSVGVKFKQWQNENEYRLIANTNSIIEGNQPLPLKIIAPFLSVTGIIIGSNMDVNNKKRVEKMANQYEMSLSKASCSTKEYKIEITGYNANSYEPVSNKDPTNVCLESEII
jgi:hypothetical protein